MNSAFVSVRCRLGPWAIPAVPGPGARGDRRGETVRPASPPTPSAWAGECVARSVAVLLALGLAFAWGLPVRSQADDLLLTTGYQNYWFTNAPTGGFTNYFGPGSSRANTAIYGGHLLGNTNAVLPKGGGFGLEWSSFGLPVASVQSDVALGDILVPPVGAAAGPPANFVAVAVGDNPAAYYECTNPRGGAFWAPASGQIIAAQPNNLTIEWRMANGTITRQLINVSAVPTKRPARLFWTESPYDAPTVSLDGRFPVIHYNSEVPPPVYEVLTNNNGGNTWYTTNVVSGVWLDDSKQLHAKGVSGLFLIEYYQEGSYEQAVQPDGLEIVQVLQPDLQIVPANVGARLLPVDTYWAQLDGIDGLLPNVTEGLNETAYLYSQTGPKDNWVFAIKRTWSEPWALEIYWQHRGRMGVVWPYEVDWYSCNWPPYPQRYVIGDVPPADTAPVLIPAGLSAEVMEDMDPPLHASISASGRSFSTTEPGLCLLRYTTPDDIWFEVVQSVQHTDDALFDLEPREWPIGQELTPGDPEAHAPAFRRHERLCRGEPGLRKPPE